MKARKCSTACATALVAVAALVAGPAAAVVLEEITVTARKMEESLQTAPVAVSAFTGEDLDVRAVTSLDDISRYAPNVEFFASGIAGKNSGQAYIRGVGQFDYLLSTDPGVGLYVDGVYLARSLGSILDLVDVERVEILRGPQGTLYGKNSVGGAINVISRKPVHEPEGRVEITTGSFDRINGRASASFPIVPEVLAARLALSTKNADGFGRRPLAGDEPGDEESNAAQATLAWTPNEQLDVLVSLDYTRTNEQFSHHHTEEINTEAPLVFFHNLFAGPLAPLHGLPLLPYDSRWITPDPFVDLSTDSNFADSEIWGVSGTITWEVGGVTVKSITAYREMDLTFGTDPDGSPVRVIDEIDTNDQEQVTQELQVTGRSFGDRLNWVGGLFYLHEDGAATLDVTAHEAIFAALQALPAALFPLAPGLACPAPPPAPCAGGFGNPLNAALAISRFSTIDQTVDSIAVYGQADYALTERLRGTYGIRYTHEEKDFEYSLFQPQLAVFTVPPAARSDSWNDVSHRIGIDYQWTDDLMTYFSAAKGFKSGGFNGRGRTANEIQSFDPEEMWTYEIGVKSEWFDRRLRANAAGFYNDYTDLQFTLSTAAADGTQVILVGNAAGAEVLGFELELLAVPIERLRLSASVGYLDAEYTEVDPGAAITTDNELIATPEWTLALGAQYAVPVGGWGEVVLRADYNYRSKIYFDAVNTESAAQEGNGLLNLRAAFDSADGHWTIASGLTNATDERYKVMGVGVLDSLGFASAIYGRPREWYLQGIYRF